MANAQQQENMLLTEHFSWPPISLIDDIINTINEVLYRCTDTFEQGISSAPPHLLGFADRYAAEKRTPPKDENGNDEYPEAALEIEEGVLKLETLMENAVDKNFDKLEIWTLRNVLCLPRGEVELANWVRLKHYDGVESLPSGGGGCTPESLFALRRKLLETQKLQAALEVERVRNEACMAMLRGLLTPAADAGTKRESTSPTVNDDATDVSAHNHHQQHPPFAFLTHTPAATALGIPTLPPSSISTSSNPPAPAPTPLSTHTTFTTSQLPYLRTLLSSLRPHLSSTALPSNTRSASEGGETEATTRERKLYLESQSKRILERRGVDTKAGVEGVVESGRVGVEEVRGLEGVVEGFARRGDGTVEDDVEGEEGDGMDTS